MKVINASDEISTMKIDSEMLLLNKIQEYLKTHNYNMNVDVQEL